MKLARLLGRFLTHIRTNSQNTQASDSLEIFRLADILPATLSLMLSARAPVNEPRGRTPTRFDTKFLISGYSDATKARRGS